MESLDVEEESVLTAIFKDAFPESWQSDHNFVHYLSELSSYGVEKLAQEPDRLSEEKSQILEETQNLAFQNYKTFIQTAECSREIFEDFQIIEKHVEDLLGKLPQFSEQCNDVLKKAQEINISRRMNNLTLQRHTQLLEILELPQLMDTCVRNGYYDEALELAAHVKRLEKKHSSISVILSIVNEVKLSTQLMLNQLIQQLRTNVQLPACLRVIGYLRRMNVFTEVELRIKFLQARDSWFQSILDAIPKEDAYTHITKTIEASRVNLFDIITQYRAIFSDEDPLLSTTKDDSLNEGALFHTWIVQKVSQFLATLEMDLSRGIGGRLDSILGQCMYFGLSFSRVGADFRGLLTPIFQQAALSGVRLSLRQANKRFDETMRSYSLLSSTGGGGGLPYNPAAQIGQLYPPTVLLDFHPLAAYCNDILTALNELRLCAPVAIVTDVCDALLESYANINKVILAFHRAEETTFDRKEKERFDNLCSAYAHTLIPYINKCLQALFPPTQLAQILGLTVSEMQKMGCVGQVNVIPAVATIKHLIPEIEVETVATQPEETTEEPIKSEISENSRLDNSRSEEIDTDNASSSATLVQQSISMEENQPIESAASFQTDESGGGLQTDQSGDGSFENQLVTGQSDEGKQMTTSVQSEASSGLGGGGGDVQFTLSSDTDSDADMDKSRTATPTSKPDFTRDVDDELDIESDLSALAADVLGTKTTVQTHDVKKND